MFKYKSLKKTLILNFSIILVAILMLVMVIALGIANVNVGKDTIMDEYNHAEKLYEAEIAHYKWSDSLNSAINYGTEFTGSTDPRECDFGQYIYGDSMQDDEHSLNFLAEIEPIHNFIHNAAQTVLSQIEINKEQATSTYLNQVVPNIDSLISKLNASIDERSILIDQANQKFIQILIFAAVACTIVVLFVLMMCIRLYLFLRNEVVINLSGIRKQVQRLSKGELGLELSTTCKTTEMIEIRDSLEFSVKELSTYVDAIDYGMTEFSKGNFTCECPITFLGDFAHIQKSIEEFQAKINDTLVEIEMVTLQVSAGANQVADGAQSLAQGATEQASSVEELSSTIAEVSIQITSNAEYSKTASDLGKQAGEVVKTSQAEMKQMMSAIKDIASASENIQRIIKTIDDIAFQTNILALNAAVESARAGNAGKGFAVVADEVRNLAQKSAEAAKETQDLIERSLEYVVNGERLAIKTDKAFDEVAKNAKEILEMVEKIADASHEQAISVGQISQGVDQISAVVQMNSATSEESAAASEELSGQASIMKSLIDEFKLNHRNNLELDTDNFRENEESSNRYEAKY